MTGDPLERLHTVVAGEMFRKPPAKALSCPDRSRPHERKVGEARASGA